MKAFLWYTGAQAYRVGGLEEFLAKANEWLDQELAR